MTTQDDLGQENRFVRAILPWLVAAAALALYVATLNHWVTFASLPYVARATGKMWGPELSGFSPLTGPFSPLHYLLTYPFRWLPEAWVPLALNLFSVVCATLTLALLARSVALLPHNRTHEQRQREHGPHALLSLPTAWIAPVLAVIICGLQLAFWQEATAASAEALNVLLFAYVIRCLLEYRIVQRDSWLFKAGLVYGAAMTGDWLMVGLAPVFILSLVLLKRSEFFHLRFLGAMLFCGVAGMMLYLLFPLVHVLSANPTGTFWQVLKVNVLAEKSWLFSMWRLPNYLLLLLATTSFLPLLLLSVRWASYFGDPSKIGIAATTAILHIAHGALLAVCVWVTFDPVFSPHYKGLSIPALDYLCALSVGYFTGYFLLVFKPLVNRGVRTPAWCFLLNRLSRAWILALLVLVPFGLIYRNLPQIKLTNGPAIREYAALLTTNLPPRAVLLCDSESLRVDMPRRLWLAEAWLARSGRAKDYLFVDTLALEAPSYHEFQRNRHPNEWPALVDPKSRTEVLPSVVLKFVVKLSDQHPVYYLDPSFGFFFEVFYPQLHGLTSELKRYPTNSLDRMPLEKTEIAENEDFWRANGPALQRLLPAIQEDDSNHATTFGGWLLNGLKIPFEPNTTAEVLGRFYSQCLDMWGVQLQQAGHLEEAGRHFDIALALCAANVVNAEIACAKVFMTEENIVTVAVEIMLGTPGSLPNVFDAVMDALDSGADSFLTTFDAFNKETDEEK